MSHAYQPKAAILGRTEHRINLPKGMKRSLDMLERNVWYVAAYDTDRAWTD